jgi:hypothetical protein
LGENYAPLKKPLDINGTKAIVKIAHPPSLCLCFFGSMLNSGGFFI